ncbi:MAG: prepilin-type N-terminal cleavage/methylation domain-containing protein, partial [Candidatus Aureabacteria bacterium]|nr:prepilin-type N-terminal cleavage/methylation domain-containing protein [Candidatus Auribacterota bacterium]
RAFTLVELLIAIALSTIISATIIYVFKAGLDSWEYGQGQALCQLSDETAVEKIIEGDYFYDGLREALEIIKAQETEIQFVPWYVQTVDKIEPGEKYQLERTLLKGASFPVGEVFNEKTKSYEFRNMGYLFEKTETSSREFVRFHVSQFYRHGRVIYYPDPRVHEDVIMRIYYEPSKKMIYREYLGVTKPLFRGEHNIISLSFRYFDSTNSEIDPGRINISKTLTTPVTAVSVEVTAESGSETYTLKSFVNIRKKGIAGSGLYLTENARVPVPDSKNIKTLTLTNFGGIFEHSTAEVLIQSESLKGQNYLVRIEFDNIDGIEYILSFSIEYPKGETVLKKDVNKPVATGLNLLTLDPSGHYDYDDDNGIEDFVSFEGDDIILSVEKMGIGGMNLFVR